MYLKSSELSGHLKPFMTDGATLTDIPGNNSLLIVEAPANMPKLRELVSQLDNKGEAAWPHICLRCHQVDAEVVREELEALLPVLGFPVTNKGPSGGQVKLTSIPRLQVLVASAALKEVLDEVERWCRLLDRTDKTAKENLFFYNVRHSNAEHLSEVLTVFFNTSATKSGKPSKTKSTSSKATPTTGRTSSSSPSSPSRASARKATREKGEGEEETVFDTPVVVYVDEVNNRLTIRTTHRAYALVKALLERQDVPQRQVMIEAAVAEVRLSENTEFGFAYAAREKFGRYDFKHAAVHTAIFDDKGIPLEPKSFATGVVMSLANGDDKVAFLKAVAGDSNVRVLSAPQILAASDEEASINVGARVPVKTSDYTDTSGTSSRATYQYEDTGTILTVTPHITAGNEVQLDVKQEVSDAVETTTGVTDSPTILNKILQTTLVIPDGSTVMMGGLIGTRNEDGHTGVPFLRDVPGLGMLFRTNKKSSARTELLVLITVNVIDQTTKTERLVGRYAAALREIQEQLGQ